MALNKSISYEIPFSETPIGEPPEILDKSQKKKVETLDEITKKLEEASDRRNSIISETRRRNSEHIQKVETVFQQKKSYEEEKVTSIRESLEMDLALNSKRREQILEAKLEKVKSEIDKVSQKNSFCEESFNKENLLTKQEMILNRLNVAAERRIQSLEDTKQKNKEIVEHALEVSKQVRQRNEEKVAEIKTNVEKDVNCKTERREEQIRAKVNSAKKQVEKVAEKLAQRSLNQSQS